jgi:hypothetical protein
MCPCWAGAITKAFVEIVTQSLPSLAIGRGAGLRSKKKRRPSLGGVLNKLLAYASGAGSVGADAAGVSAAAGAEAVSAEASTGAAVSVAVGAASVTGSNIGSGVRAGRSV